MLMFVIQHQPHRAGTDLGRELVACLLAHGSTFSRVGASGKLGAVHYCRRVELGIVHTSMRKAPRKGVWRLHNKDQKSNCAASSTGQTARLTRATIEYVG